MKTWLTKTFNLKYPIIQAPMFLVSNEEMLIAAARAGITGCVPALNWKDSNDFKKALLNLKENCPGAFGVNLIANKSNYQLEKQIQALEEVPCDYIITSLGNPKDIIKRLSPKGTKIICDVVDAEYAKKCEDLGADALIAVNSGAGGHAGPSPASILIPTLKKACSLPIISAGGVGTSSGLLSMILLGAEGVSIGSPFIATKEAHVTKDYKDAICQYGAKDIVMTNKISGTPCSVIQTPYVKKIGTEQNIVESFLNKNRNLKKYAKMLTYYKGMKSLEKAAFSASYKTVWCAGPSIEFIKEIQSVEEIVDQITKDIPKEMERLQSLI